MYKNAKKILGTLLCLSSLTAMACDVDGKTGYMPENDMYISVDQKGINSMTEATFNKVIDRAIEHYEPIIESKGKKLSVSRKWEDGTVNAYARQSGNTWMVAMFGGLARHELVSADGFALVLCHELGHHLAGAPKTTRFFMTTWASNEGQSDYWATAKCFRRIYQDDDNAAIVENMEIDAEVAKQCNDKWSSPADINLCKRMAQASKGLAQLLNGGKKVSFSTPDKKVVSKTNHKHPAGQCRLDTYFQGALCDKSLEDEVSNRDEKQGVCNRSEDYNVGIRPLCWFKPSRS